MYYLNGRQNLFAHKKKILLSLTLGFSLMSTLRYRYHTHQYVYGKSMSLLAASTAMLITGTIVLLFFFLAVIFDYNLNLDHVVFGLQSLIFIVIYICISYRQKIPFSTYSRLLKVEDSLSCATKKKISFRAFFFLIGCFIYMTLYFPLALLLKFVFFSIRSPITSYFNS